MSRLEMKAINTKPFCTLIVRCGRIHLSVKYTFVFWWFVTDYQKIITRRNELILTEWMSIFRLLGTKTNLEKKHYVSLTRCVVHCFWKRSWKDTRMSKWSIKKVEILWPIGYLRNPRSVITSHGSRQGYVLF